MTTSAEVVLHSVVHAFMIPAFPMHRLVTASLHVIRGVRTSESPCRARAALCIAVGPDLRRERPASVRRLVLLPVAHRKQRILHRLAERDHVHENSVSRSPPWRATFAVTKLFPVCPVCPCALRGALRATNQPSIMMCLPRIHRCIAVPGSPRNRVVRSVNIWRMRDRQVSGSGAGRSRVSDSSTLVVAVHLQGAMDGDGHQ